MNFKETPKGSTDRFKYRAELYDRYRDNKETTLDESLKFYVDFGKMSSKNVSLVTFKDHAKNTLNLAVATKNKVAEMRMNLENIPVPDMIHLNKHTV